MSAFDSSENRIIRPGPTALVIFGVTGDLSRKKLLPSLFELHLAGLLPDQFALLGCSRREYRDEDFRSLVGEWLEDESDGKDADALKSFLGKVYFSQLDASSDEAYEALSNKLKAVDDELGTPLDRLFYLATAPRHFELVASGLGHAGLAEAVDSGRKSVLVVEKPFGKDLATARSLNEALLQHFREEQIYRIDHYLGKETVQNILVFRFANGIFEPLWNNRFIDHMQITVAESDGIESRADYFESAGILRDIVQNHVLQMLSLICIEPPHSLSDPQAIRDEKVKVLRCVKPFTQPDIFKRTVRAQYSAGYIAGEKVVAYLEEEGVAPASETETFSALRFEIDNWRWTGVPIYVRVGKRLPKKITEIAITFKEPPFTPFEGRQVYEIEPNILSIRVQPNEGISLSMNSKPPGPRMRVNSVKMDFRYGFSYGVASPGAYERLILDAMRGDPTLFTRNDEIEEAWKILDPVLQAWESGKGPELYQYQSGSWGPKASADMIRQKKLSWRSL